MCTKCMHGHRLVKTADGKTYCKEERTTCNPDEDERIRFPNIDKIGRGS